MPASIGVNLRVTGHCRQGGRKYMEDFFSVAYQQTEDERDLEYAFFGIYDGHGGAEAAAFAKERLMETIVRHKNFWSDNDEDVLRAIKLGYIATHYAMWKEQDKWPKTASGLPSTAGTTASIAFIRRGKIYIGHVGDSGIVLGYQEPGCADWKSKPLTRDHKPECAIEMSRIEQCGGKVVAKSGVPRVVWNRPRIGHKGPVRRSTPIDEIPFLAVARSLGDLWSYNSELDEFVVSPDPDCSVIPIDTSTFRCLIFGTDGLYNMLSPQMAVHIVQQAEKHNEEAALSDSPNKVWLNPSKCLVERALELWSTTKMRADNTSVVTLMLDPPGPPRAQVLRNRKKNYPDSGLQIVTRYQNETPEQRKALIEGSSGNKSMGVPPAPKPPLYCKDASAGDSTTSHPANEETADAKSANPVVPTSDFDRTFFLKPRESLSYDPRFSQNKSSITANPDCKNASCKNSDCPQSRSLDTSNLLSKRIDPKASGIYDCRITSESRVGHVSRSKDAESKSSVTRTFKTTETKSSGMHTCKMIETRCTRSVEYRSAEAKLSPKSCQSKELDAKYYSCKGVTVADHPTTRGHSSRTSSFKTPNARNLISRSQDAVSKSSEPANFNCRYRSCENFASTSFASCSCGRSNTDTVADNKHCDYPSTRNCCGTRARTSSARSYDCENCCRDCFCDSPAEGVDCLPSSSSEETNRSRGCASPKGEENIQIHEISSSSNDVDDSDDSACISDPRKSRGNKNVKKRNAKKLQEITRQFENSKNVPSMKTASAHRTRKRLAEHADELLDVKRRRVCVPVTVRKLRARNLKSPVESTTMTKGVENVRLTESRLRSRKTYLKATIACQEDLRAKPNIRKSIHEKKSPLSLKPISRVSKRSPRRVQNILAERLRVRKAAVKSKIAQKLKKNLSDKLLQRNIVCNSKLQSVTREKRSKVNKETAKKQNTGNTKIPNVVKTNQGKSKKESKAVSHTSIKNLSTSVHGRRSIRGDSDASSCFLYNTSSSSQDISSTSVESVTSNSASVRNFKPKLFSPRASKGSKASKRNINKENGVECTSLNRKSLRYTTKSDCPNWTLQESNKKSLSRSVASRMAVKEDLSENFNLKNARTAKRIDGALGDRSFLHKLRKRVTYRNQNK